MLASTAAASSFTSNSAVGIDVSRTCKKSNLYNHNDNES